MSNLKKILIFFVSILLISSCSSGEKEELKEEKVEKKDFFIQTEKITNFGNGYQLKKT